MTLQPQQPGSGTFRVAVRIRPLNYRADGWPLCPRCGEDALADLEHERASADGRLFCYRCGRITANRRAPA